jgi:Phage tail tube protein
MALGVDALTRFQSGTEATPGTAVPATRIDYIEPGYYFKDMIEKVKPNEARNSYVRNYRDFQVKRHAELSGMPFAACYETLARYLQFGAKGGVTGGAGDAGTPPMYTYTFKRTPTSNDLKHATWEVGDNITAFQIAGAVLNRWDLKCTAGGALKGTMDWLGLTSTTASFTGSLADTTPEDIIGAKGLVYIDDTTIGTTLAAYATDLSFSHDNGWAQLWAFTGNITPKENYRPEPSKADLEIKLAFDTTAEYTKFVNNTTRHIEYKVPGAIIHDAVTSMLKVDWHGPYDKYDIGSEGGLHVATISGESQYNSGLASDWQVVIQTGLAAIP